MQQPVCVVIGVGPGNGVALSKRFAHEGYRVAMLTRSEDKLREYERAIPHSWGISCDASNADALRSALDTVVTSWADVDVLIYNAGAGVWGTFEDVSAEDFETTWRVNARGLYVAAQHAAPSMAERGQGAILVIGAGAAWRGRPKTVAFAAAKAAQRSLAQSLARQLGPRGVHVAYFVIDGVIDLPRTREMMPNKPDDFFLQPDAIATSVYQTATQPRSAWSFEVELRPFGENW